MTRRPARTLVVIWVVVASACTATGSEAPGTQPGPLTWFLSTDAPPPPELDSQLVADGEALYQQSCASCHGTDLSGEPNWKTRKPDGSYPPPPHDSTGHTWHHSDQLLLELIRDGSEFPESRMPAFAEQLTDEEIVSILEFLKSVWGEQERGFQWEITWRETQGSP